MIDNEESKYIRQECLTVLKNLGHKLRIDNWYTNYFSNGSYSIICHNPECLYKFDLQANDESVLGTGLIKRYCLWKNCTTLAVFDGLNPRQHIIFPKSKVICKKFQAMI